MKKHLLKQTFKDTKMMITYVIMNDKWLLLLKLLGVLVSALQTYVGTLYIKWILDYITDVIQNQNFQFTSNSVYYKDIVKTILVIQCIALLLFSITTLITKIIVPRREYKLRNRLQNIFIEKATLQDLECYEDFGFYDNYTKSVRYADTKALEFLNILFSVVQNVLNIIAIASIIFTLDKYVVLIIIVMVVLSFVDQNISNRYSYEQYEAEESINRRAEYVKKVAHHKDYAKEVRIFRLGDFLISKLNSAFNEKYILYRETNTKYWRFKYIINLINTLIITPILLIYISVGVIIGNITIGSFTVLFNSCYSISAYLSAIIGALDRLTFESEYYVCKLRTILKKQSKIEQPNNEKIILDKIETIEFRNVWFHYPHHSENVLKDVSFKIEENDTIALVGKNGAANQRS